MYSHPELRFRIFPNFYFDFQCIDLAVRGVYECQHLAEFFVKIIFKAVPPARLDLTGFENLSNLHRLVE